MSDIQLVNTNSVVTPIEPQPKSLNNQPGVKTNTNSSLAQQDFVVYTVKKGDCLWNIAKTNLKNPNDWNTIYNLNKDKIENPDLIYPDQKLTLPINLIKKSQQVEQPVKVEKTEPVVNVEKNEAPKDDIEWALDLQKKLENGYKPTNEEITRYAQIFNKHKGILPEKQVETKNETEIVKPVEIPTDKTNVVLNPKHTVDLKDLKPTKIDEPEKKKGMSSTLKNGLIGGAIGGTAMGSFLMGMRLSLTKPASNLGGYVVAQKLAKLVGIKGGPALSSKIAKIGGPAVAGAILVGSAAVATGALTAGATSAVTHFNKSTVLK